MLTLAERPVRVRCALAAEFRRDGGDVIPVTVLDLSLNGAFLETDADLQVGDEGELRLVDSGLRCRATVTRLATAQRQLPDRSGALIAVSRPGVAVAFNDRSGGTVIQRLARIVDALDES